MSNMLEARPVRIEREFAILKAHSAREKSNWIAVITGTFEHDADFDEKVRLGKEMRNLEETDED